MVGWTASADASKVGRETLCSREPGRTDFPWEDGIDSGRRRRRVEQGRHGIPGGEPRLAVESRAGSGRRRSVRGNPGRACEGGFSRPYRVRRVLGQEPAGAHRAEPENGREHRHRCREGAGLQGRQNTSQLGELTFGRHKHVESAATHMDYRLDGTGSETLCCGLPVFEECRRIRYSKPGR